MKRRTLWGEILLTIHRYSCVILYETSVSLCARVLPFQLNARAVSHLERVSGDGMRAMAERGSVAVLLPTTVCILFGLLFVSCIVVIFLCVFLVQMN